MNLISAFAASVKQRPDETALFWGDEQFVYQQLWDRAAQVAARLQSEFGVKPGQRVGLWLKNSPEFIFAFFGILRTGAVVVPINSFLKSEEVSFILQDA